jgi:uncharacterized protein
MRFFILALLCCLFLMPAAAGAQNLSDTIVQAAIAQTQKAGGYDGRYIKIPYPNGDVPAQTGVCTDVIIRAYRAAGIDLQQKVHVDMKAHFGLYPKLWGLARPDTNIDHRRVPNLQVFFTRHGTSLAISDDPSDYKAGDMVTWNLRSNGGSLPHIGIITDKKSADGKRPLVAHNIGAGPQLEDMLFDYTITGHYRYPPAPENTVK